MALPRHPPSLERYAAARRLMARVPGADANAIDTCLSLWRFSEEMSASFEAFYAAHRLSSARGHVLAQLLEAERGLTPAQLADRAGMTPSSMTGADLAGTLSPEERRAMLSGSRRLWERARALTALLPDPDSDRRDSRERNGHRRRPRG